MRIDDKCDTDVFMACIWSRDVMTPPVSVPAGRTCEHTRLTHWEFTFSAYLSVGLKALRYLLNCFGLQFEISAYGDSVCNDYEYQSVNARWWITAVMMTV